MIDYDRVSIMTRLAVMEDHEGREMMRLCSYRKIDYVLTEIFKAFVAGTVCYLLGLLLWFLYLWDSLNEFIVDLDVEQLLVDISFRYILIVGAYVLVCAIIAARRHTKRMAQRYTYLSYLRALRRSYVKDSASRPVRRTGSKNGSSVRGRQEET